MVKHTFGINHETLQRIWDLHGLGKITAVEWTTRGRNNPTLIVNQTLVIRFDGLINKGVSRFRGEERAYDALRAAHVPVPQVIAVDDSKSLIPADYMIMSKVEGQPLIEGWSALSPIQQERAAYEAGSLLARMHEVTFDTFGRLYGGERIFDRWSDYLQDYFRRYRDEAEGILSPTTLEQMAMVLTQYQPVFDSVTRAHLVHWDYHFENLLQQDGVITGVLDFEWALSGDPAHDFNRRDQWEDDCPGSRRPLYQGYVSVRPLDPDHDLRVSLYELLWYLDCVVDAYDDVEADEMRLRLLKTLEKLT